MVQAPASQNSEMAAHVVTHYATLQGIARGAQLRHGLPADMRVDLVQNLVLRLLELERASSVPELVPGSGPWLGWITTVCRIVALESRRALGQRTLSLTPDDVREQCANCEANLASRCSGLQEGWGLSDLGDLAAASSSELTTAQLAALRALLRTGSQARAAAELAIDRKSMCERLSGAVRRLRRLAESTPGDHHVPRWLARDVAADLRRHRWPLIWHLHAVEGVPVRDVASRVGMATRQVRRIVKDWRHRGYLPS